MVATDPEDAEAGQEVQIPLTVAVEEPGALGPFVHPVEADGVEHPRVSAG